MKLNIYDRWKNKKLGDIIPGKIAELIRRVLIVVFAGIMIYSLSILAYKLYDSHRSKNIYKDISKLYDDLKNEEDNVETTEDNNDKYTFIINNTVISEGLAYPLDGSVKLSGSRNKDKELAILRAQNLMEKQKSDQYVKRVLLLEKLKNVNKDIVGWITIDDTKVDYPVVQTKDNEFYLEHDVTGAKSSHGTIFMDYNDKIDKTGKIMPRNIILYGHHMKDGSMFASLRSLKDPKFTKKNPTFSFDIFPGKYTWEIFSIYVADSDFEYRKTDFKNDVEFAAFLKSIEDKSIRKFNVPVTAEDTVLTLSTCSYEFEEARLVVHAKLVKKQ